MIETTILFLMVIPGIVLALRGSSYLVDYTILVFVFNREIRRIVDYYNHEFNALSPISVTPLIMLALLFISFVGRFKVLHPEGKTDLCVVVGCHRLRFRHWNHSQWSGLHFSGESSIYRQSG